ncbi:MAG: hypothetical protein HY303_12185 [Candidatus Wallbacteria bacterium]|nr:hypothetical protein [Candidatus Wallbacteria bacterium]
MRCSALVPLLLLVSVASAADLPSPVVGSLREAIALSRFLRMGKTEPAAGDRFAVVGLNVTQENGQGNLAIQQLQVSLGGKTTLMSGIKVSGPLVVDDAYINNPVGGLLTAILKKGEVHIDQIDSSGAASSGGGQTLGAKDVTVRLTQGSFDCSLTYGMFGARVAGTAAYDPQARKLVVTIASVSAGIPIGLDKIFAELAKTLTFDWTVVSQPTITLVFDETFR